MVIVDDRQMNWTRNRLLSQPKVKKDSYDTCRPLIIFSTILDKTLRDISLMEFKFNLLQNGVPFSSTGLTKPLKISIYREDIFLKNLTFG